MKLTLPVGNTILGNPMPTVDIELSPKFPTVAVAGSTCSGKSAMLKTLCSTLIYGSSDCKLDVLFYDGKDPTASEEFTVSNPFMHTYKQSPIALNICKGYIQSGAYRLDTTALVLMTDEVSPTALHEIITLLNSPDMSQNIFLFSAFTPRDVCEDPWFGKYYHRICLKCEEDVSMHMLGHTAASRLYESPGYAFISDIMTPPENISLAEI